MLRLVQSKNLDCRFRYSYPESLKILSYTMSPSQNLTHEDGHFRDCVDARNSCYRLAPDRTHLAPIEASPV
jgi:hypothetical protein